MMQIPGVVPVRFEAYLEVAKPNLYKNGICLNLTCQLHIRNHSVKIRDNILINCQAKIT